jgi:hypothetical protein
LSTVATVAVSLHPNYSRKQGKSGNERLQPEKQAASSLLMLYKSMIPAGSLGIGLINSYLFIIILQADLGHPTQVIAGLIGRQNHKYQALEELV